MAREPIGWFESLTQTGDVLADWFQCAHVSVLTRRN
jgi:hypothetical protein